MKDQGQCGSCWAFSTTQSLESANLMKKYKAGDTQPTMDPLGPQGLVSCDPLDNGCHGGNPIQAMGWLESTGLETEAD